MIQIRKSNERGHFDHGWLKTYHTFSFDQYVDPKNTHFHALRVINEDWIQAGTEFPTHPHRDMEIITYVIDGQLTHKDNMGNGSTISAGEVQRMTAGSGIFHSESNNHDTDEVHLLQIWIFPDEKGLTPEYDQKSFSTEDKLNRFCLIASPDGADGSMTIHRDVRLSASILKGGVHLQYDLKNGRHAWVQVVSGDLMCNNQRLLAGDAAAISEVSTVKLVSKTDCELLFFDVG